MADSLETEQGRFEYYKKKLEEEKASVPQLTEASPKAVELAMHEANGDIFPPMGFINFNKVPEGVDPEKFIGYKVDDILRGTVKYLEDLGEQPPRYLSGWGIANLPVFKDSEAAKNLATITKTDYSKISQEIYNLEDGDEADFNNPVMEKLNSKDLQDLLDSTMLNFLKEIGVKRSGGGVSNDDFILEKSQTIYDFLDKANTPPQPEAVPAPTPDIVQPAEIKENTPPKVTEAEKMEPVPVSPAPAAPAIPVSPPAAPQNTPGSIAVSQQQDVKVNIVEKAQPPIEPARQEANAQENVTVTETTNTAAESLSETSPGVSTPLLDILGASSGMKSEDIAKMFQEEGGMEKLQQGLDLSFPGAPENVEAQITAAVNQTTGAAKIETPSTAQAAIKRSEPAKMAEPVEPAPPPAAPAVQQEVVAPTKQEDTQINTATTEAEAKSKEITPEQEPNSTGDNKDQVQTNDELLKVMRDVLKALQGPLIVTDGKQYFS